MGRQLRPTLPGAPFHITARTQWKEPLFQGVEAEIAALIRGSIDRSDARLLAYAVMSNHIHVIVVQGRRPLAGYMQPLLRRIALLINRCRRPIEGHVFAGRYHHSVCQDPEYFRSMVAYVHLNPVRAGICARPDQYAWTSHRDYARGPDPAAPPAYVHAIERGVRVFARKSQHTPHACQRDYRRYVTWRLAMDRYLAADDRASWRPVPRQPLAVGGDLHWQEEYGTATTLRLMRTDDNERRADLRDHVVSALEHIAPDLPLEQLCGGGRSRALVRVRNEVIARAITAGYRTGKLATFLNISPSAVSGVRTRLRERATS